MNRPPPTLRRRFDTQVLRWQARLDSEWADRFLPWIAASGLTILYFALAEARVRSLEPQSELAATVQGMWLISHGHGADLTITGTHLLAQHLPLGLYPVAYLTRIIPAVPALLLLQAAGLAFGVVPLWRIARRVAELRVGAAIALTIAYGASPTLNNLNLASFHTTAVAVAPMLAATHMALRHRWKGFWILSGVVVIWGAELALVVAGLGLLIFVNGDRKVGTRAVIAGVAYTIVAVVVLEPRFGSTGFVAPGAFRAYGSNAFSIVGGMAIHPHDVVGDLLAEENVRFLIALFAPLLFLPVLAPRYLLPAAPLTILYLVADVPVRASFVVEFGLPLTVFAFVASTFALARMGRRSVERIVVDRRVLIALMAASIGFWCIDAANSPYQRPWGWGGEDAADTARHDAADLVEDNEDIAVRASPTVLALIAERTRVYELRSDDPADAASNDVSVVILDGNTTRWTSSQWLSFTTGLARRGFTIESASNGIDVYSRAGP